MSTKNTPKNSKVPLEKDAHYIIECFGGIRPMAKKLGVAVTTVQGWKKRNVIPNARMDHIRQIATDNNIELSGKSKSTDTLEKNDNTKSQRHMPASQGNVTDMRGQQGKDSSPTTHEIKYIESSGLSGRTTFIGLLVLIAFMVAGLMTIAPKVKVVSEQADRITGLERELKVVQKKQSVLSKIIPNDLNNKLKIIEQKAQSASQKAQDLANGAKNMAQMLNSGSVDERLELIEEQIGTYIDEKSSLNLSGVWHYMQALRGTEEGSDQLNNTSKDLLSWINRLQSDEVTVEEALPVIVEESSLIAKTLGDVEKENLKAAAMLLAMSQLRDSLSRDNESFDQDLLLLQKLVGEENPALSASIEKLSPHAAQGVLTPKGLSTEFRKLAGDVVVSSLSGEDVSISEKARSRFGEILVVKKNGEQITGTETQRTVADAQKLIDGGDIQGTIQVLQNLDGDAAKTVAPFLQEAQFSLLASQIQELLGQNIQSKIRVSSLTSGKTVTNGLGLENIIDDIKEAVPLGGKIYEDPDSGLKIYRK